ncbi:glycosyltransferase family 2 protein [Aurantiacibacter poecillastricola]|uniref:glycosyltransferase family 2 protein n=1 Tax=Aurantiacibacter poecillastricola TaxID=3064385 RepID=UPI00273EC7B8|nr:glycosyltransferase family 2 protein [Aurantiacibacter sp. 219JJ12-13]MDP5263220.1 glycosyltransferase family 2 protein [Aurantiacibacter sp. 219JJ12-13]
MFDPKRSQSPGNQPELVSRFCPTTKQTHGRTKSTLIKMAGPFCVVIPAYNAQSTIGRAIASACQAEVSEIVVIDDASDDATAARAGEADDGSGRLFVIRSEQNLGPAAARNLAIANTTAPFIALLDADDYFLPGRFAALDPECGGWDLLADNIRFVPEESGTSSRAIAPNGNTVTPRQLDFEGFVAGNIGRPGEQRGEMGFLKPVIRRDFLVRHDLSYDAQMRLGEDFDLYARMLALGARFGVTSACYYVAVERRASLSSSHRTEDLAALLASIERLSCSSNETHREAIAPLREQVAQRWRLRSFLDDKRNLGLWRALTEGAWAPAELRGILAQIARDKIANHRGSEPRKARVRMLLQGSDWGRQLPL